MSPQKPSDLKPSSKGSGAICFRKCNVSYWAELLDAFLAVPNFEFVFANAGVSEECDYFADTFDDAGRLLEPSYSVLDMKFTAVMNTVKLSLGLMRERGVHGSIVITTSATAYGPEQSLSVYSAGKLAVSQIGRCVMYRSISLTHSRTACSLDSRASVHHHKRLHHDQRSSTSRNPDQAAPGRLGRAYYGPGATSQQGRICRPCTGVLGNSSSVKACRSLWKRIRVRTLGKGKVEWPYDNDAWRSVH